MSLPDLHELINSLVFSTFLKLPFLSINRYIIRYMEIHMYIYIYIDYILIV